MGKLHSQLALFGSIDDEVAERNDPRTAAVVERFLPGTTGLGQRGWYGDLRRITTRCADGDEVRFPTRQEALIDLTATSRPMRTSVDLDDPGDTASDRRGQRFARDRDEPDEGRVAHGAACGDPGRCGVRRSDSDRAANRAATSPDARVTTLGLRWGDGRCTLPLIDDFGQAHTAVDDATTKIESRHYDLDDRMNTATKLGEIALIDGIDLARHHCRGAGSPRNRTDHVTRVLRGSRLPGTRTQTGGRGTLHTDQGRRGELSVETARAGSGVGHHRAVGIQLVRLLK